MVVILGAVSVRGVQLQKKLEGYEARKEELQQQIAEEEQRTKDIEEYSKYTKVRSSSRTQESEEGSDSSAVRSFRLESKRHRGWNKRCSVL